MAGLSIVSCFVFFHIRSLFGEENIMNARNLDGGKLQNYSSGRNLGIPKSYLATLSLAYSRSILNCTPQGKILSLPSVFYYCCART